MREKRAAATSVGQRHQRTEVAKSGAAADAPEKERLFMTIRSKA
jgi:hypothetical protein